MKNIFTIIAILTTLLAIALSILPFGNIAYIPIIIAFVSALLAMRQFQKEGKSTSLIKTVFLGIIIALGITIYHSVFTTNQVVETEQSIEKEKQSEEEAIKELEDIATDE